MEYGCPDTMVFFKDSDPETLSGRFGYPFVVKPDSGFGGIGVELIHNGQELKDYFATLSYGQAYVAQEYIATSKEETSVLLFSMADITFSMERHASNLMNSVRMYMWVELHRRRLLPKKKKVFCEKVASIFDLPIIGLDLMIGDGEYVLAEVNAFPGMSGRKMMDAYASVIDDFMEGQA